MCQNLNIFCPRLTVGSTFNPRQYLQSFEISKQISCVLRGIKRAISRKLVKISDWRVSSFLKTVPGCRVSRHGVNKILVDSKESFQLFELCTNLFDGRIAKKV